MFCVRVILENGKWPTFKEALRVLLLFSVVVVLAITLTHVTVLVVLHV